MILLPTLIVFLIFIWRPCWGISGTPTYPSSSTAADKGDVTEPNFDAPERAVARLGTPSAQRKLNVTVSISAANSTEIRGRGEWEPDLFDLKLNPIHSLLTPAGKVLMYGTDDQGDNHEDGGNKIFYEVWDLKKGVQGEAHELLEHFTVIDIFCSNMNVDPSTGNVIIIGGDDRDLNGIKNALEYNIRTDLIRNHPAGSMRYARWYATSINLPNGDIFVTGGSDENRNGAFIPEVWSPETGFRRLRGARNPVMKKYPGPPHWWYPHTYVNSKGEIVVIMPHDMPRRKKARLFRVGVEGRGSIEGIGRKPFLADVLSPSIMFRVDRILMLSDDGWLWVVDISDLTPPLLFNKWERKAMIGHSRTNASFVMLPDGRVAIVGGCKSQANFGTTLSDAVKYIQIWDPVTNTLVDGDEETQARLYHSTALILPDGRLFSGGGGTPGPVLNLNGQLFSPDYLFDENQGNVSRSIIVHCPSNIETGDSFNITVDDTSRISKVTATKSGAITHTRNCDTRWLDLKFDVLNGTELRVYSEDMNIMIAGLWLLTVLDMNGVPSEASLLGVNMAALD